MSPIIEIYTKKCKELGPISDPVVFSPVFWLSGGHEGSDK